jgi:hypothetical protein
MNGAADGPGADDSGGAVHKVGPPRTPFAGGPVRAAGASGARVTHESERVGRPENADALRAGLVVKSAWSRCPLAGAACGLHRALSVGHQLTASAPGRSARTQGPLGERLQLATGQREAIGVSVGKDERTPPGAVTLLVRPKTEAR